MDSSIGPIITCDEGYLYKGQERFLVRGIQYNPRLRPDQEMIRRIRSTDPSKQIGRRRTTTDALDDVRYIDLLRDLEALKELGINTLWVRHCDPAVSHLKCMDLLAMNGIYVVFEIAHTETTLHYEPPENAYNEDVLNVLCETIDCVANYPNTLGICISRSLAVETATPKVMKHSEIQSRIIRDLKQYMRFKNSDTGQRIIPLSVVDSQWASLNTNTFHFLTDPEADGRAAGGKPDFYCFVQYDASVSHDIPSTVAPNDFLQPSLLDRQSLAAPDSLMHEGSWADRIPVQKFVDAQEPIPVLVMVFGHRIRNVRTFPEIQQLYGESMNSPLLNVLSGGFIHQVYDETLRDGLVHDHNGSGLVKTSDYYAYQDAMALAVGHPPEGHSKIKRDLALQQAKGLINKGL